MRLSIALRTRRSPRAAAAGRPRRWVRLPRRGSVSSRGLTLLEVLVATAILSGLILAVGAATIPMHRQVQTSSIQLDMDRAARRVLAELRRELRQSGNELGGGDMLTAPAPLTATDPAAPAAVDLLTYRRRTGLGPGDWSAPITIRAVPDGTFKGTPAPTPRWALVRVQDLNGDGVAEQVHLLRDVLSFRAERPLNSRSVILRLELLTPDPLWKGGRASAPFVHVYEDQVELLNRGS